MHSGSIKIIPLNLPDLEHILCAKMN